MKSILAVHFEGGTFEYKFSDGDKNEAFFWAFTNLDEKQEYKNVADPTDILLLNAARNGDHYAARRLMYRLRARSHGTRFSVYPVCQSGTPT